MSAPAVSSGGLGDEALAERRVGKPRRPGGNMPRPARIGLYVFLVTAALL